MSDSTAAEHARPVTPPIALADLDLARSKLGIVLRVFVAGPYIDAAWTEADYSAKDPAAVLRIRIMQCIEKELHHKALLGEHRGVAEMAEKHFGSLATVVLSEVAMVKDSDAVIIIPSSPGSFCELGAWVNMDPVAKKMLVLGDKRFEPDKSYVSLGVFKMAIDAGATVQWVDYTKPDLILPLVRDHVARAHAIALKQKVLHGA